MINIEELYTRYGPMVLRRCRAILKDEDAACDAMQEVFVKLIQSREKLTGAYPSSLLFRMATNTCLNMIRNARSLSVDPAGPLLSSIPDRDNTHERIILSDYLDYLFKAEPSTTRDMAYMHYVDGMTYDEVAEETGLSVSGVRKRLRTFQEKIDPLCEAEQ
ncbi:MAG: RNA polymerase sigma factor [Spirochaetota bacterium]